jgi:hypothetical protein
MMNLLSDIWSILTPLQRRYVLVAQFASLLMAFSTVTGIAAIAPYVVQISFFNDPQGRSAARRFALIDECGKPTTSTRERSAPDAARVQVAS